MNKILFSVITAITLLVTLGTPADASPKIAGNSAILLTNASQAKDDKRTVVLRAYLEKRNSPLADSAETFVKEADENGLDWRFVAAIAGLESSFGKRLPYNSYNAWGWGIYGDNVIYFPSFDAGIKVISKSLRDRYMDQWGAKDVYAIGKFYASSPTWAQRVEFIMEDIERFSQKEDDRVLSLTL